MGRPKKWNEIDMPSRLDSVTGWAKQGSTDEEIAKMLGVSLAVFYNWKNDYPEFKEAIKKGKEVSNGELLNSAFIQSTGFTAKEQQAIKVRDYKRIDGKLMQIERVEVIEVEKYYPPNPTMSIFMLKNRLPEQYKDKREHEHTGKDGGPIELQGLTDDELDSKIQRLIQQNQRG